MQFRDLNQLRCRGLQWKDRCGSDKPWALMREGAGVNSDLPWRSLGHVHWCLNCRPRLGLLHTRGIYFHAPFSSRARATHQSPLSLGPVLCIKWASGEQSVGVEGWHYKHVLASFLFQPHSRDSQPGTFPKLSWSPVCTACQSNH